MMTRNVIDIDTILEVLNEEVSEMRLQQEQQHRILRKLGILRKQRIDD